MAGRHARDRDSLPILRENWAVVRVFMQMRTQWRRAGSTGIMTGMDYSPLDMVATALGVNLDAELLGKIQHMEFAVLEELAKA